MLLQASLTILYYINIYIYIYVYKYNKHGLGRKHKHEHLKTDRTMLHYILYYNMTHSMIS